MMFTRSVRDWKRKKTMKMPFWTTIIPFLLSVAPGRSAALLAMARARSTAAEAVMKPSTRVVQVALADALAKGPPPPGNLAVVAFWALVIDHAPWLMHGAGGIE